MSWFYLLVAILAIATVISLVLSFVVGLFVGALKLLPFVFIALLVAVLLGKIDITIKK